MDIESLKRTVRRTNDRQRERITFPARIDALTAEVLTEIAKEHNVSRNMLINAILEEFVETYTN